MESNLHGVLRVMGHFRIKIMAWKFSPQSLSTPGVVEGGSDLHGALGLMERQQWAN